MLIAWENNKNFTYEIKENETLHDAALNFFEILKKENLKSIWIFDANDPALKEATPILEYDDDDDEGVHFWVIP